jgi:hypothetical protein
MNLFNLTNEQKERSNKLIFGFKYKEFNKRFKEYIKVSNDIFILSNKTKILFNEIIREEKAFNQVMNELKENPKTLKKDVLNSNIDVLINIVKEESKTLNKTIKEVDKEDIEIEDLANKIKENNNLVSFISR